MKMTINARDMKQTFEKWNRGCFTYEACKALLNYYDEIDENMEFDPIAICCECAEYTPKKLINEYSEYVLSPEEWEEEAPENNIYNEENQDKYISRLVEELEEKTTVLSLENGNYIVFNY